MQLTFVRILRRAVALGSGALLAGSLSLTGVASAHPARPLTPSAAVVAGSDYLALGDSVSFGYREPDTTPAPDYEDQAQFVGYPEDVAAALGLHVANLSCPGETSASLINPDAPRNGCENSYQDAHQFPVGYRTLYPLHWRYSGSQLAAAVRYLKFHPHTRLVSLMIGANDGFLCEAKTTDNCAAPSQRKALAEEIAAHVGLILRTLRYVAHYRDQIVNVPYYSTDSASPEATAGTVLINSALIAGARPYHVEVAPSFAAFDAA